jgi:hypothetical protein
MKIIENSVYSKFETIVNRYLIFLVHVQNSSKISNTNKIDIFNKAEELSKEIYSSVQGVNSNQNEYNIAEKKKIALDAISNSSKIILKELEYYKTDVVISDESSFLLNDIIRSLSKSDATFKMSILSIERLYYFKELAKDKKQEEHLNNELAELKNKDRTEFDELKLKAFLDFLQKPNNNPKLFYKVNCFIFGVYEKEEIIFITPLQKTDIKHGLYFIMNKDDISINRIAGDGFIEYTIRFTDFKENFSIYIFGSITVNGTREEFTINETYPNSMRGNVVNAFNLKGIIEKFNELYIKVMNKKDKPDKNNDIDDYLTGRIKNT